MQDMKFAIWLLAFTLTGAAAGQSAPLGIAHVQLPPDASVTPVHGCHGGYAHDLRGWHRHGKHCEAQRGLVRAKRDKKRSI
jgi:hypothetical protein